MAKNKKKYPHLTPLLPLIHADMVFNFTVLIFWSRGHEYVIPFWIFVVLLIVYSVTVFIPNSPQNRLILGLQMKADVWWYERRYGKIGATVKTPPPPVWIYGKPEDEQIEN